MNATDARRAREIIAALLRVVDRHILAWSWFPEDRDACDAAREFLEASR